MLKTEHTSCCVFIGFHPRYRGNYRTDGYRNGETGYNGSWRGPRRGLVAFLLFVLNLDALMLCKHLRKTRERIRGGSAGRE